MHLAVAISSHGFGHGAQTAAVLAALRARHPDIRLTLLTGLPEAFLRERIPGAFDRVDWRGDFGMQMVSALDVDLERSAADYAAFHAEWDLQCAQAGALLERISPDLLLANVPYLPLAAAARIGLPSMALCSLNWALIYEHYFHQRPEAPTILKHMQTAYASARVFLCPAPSLPMPTLGNVRAIGPLARLGQDCRAELRARLGIAASKRLVMIAPGGMPLRLSMRDWPVHDDLHWVVPAEWAAARPDVHRFDTLGLGFTDVLASVDAVLGKLGYGTVAECACNGTPLLYIPRPDWPEEGVLADWLHRHGRCAPISREVLHDGRLRDTLDALWAQPAPPCPQPTGADAAAAAIVAELSIT
jgi:hypothetical protein